MRLLSGGKKEKRQQLITIAAFAVVVFLLCIYGRFDPEDPEIGKYFPKCLLNTLTGLQCPSCGVQRAAHSLMHGDIYGALSQNWFLLFSLGYLFSLAITRYFPFQSPLRQFLWGKRGCFLYIALYFAWFIIRNAAGI